MVTKKVATAVAQKVDSQPTAEKTVKKKAPVKKTQTAKAKKETPEVVEPTLKAFTEDKAVPEKPEKAVKNELSTKLYWNIMDTLYYGTRVIVALSMAVIAYKM